ncbi:MAG: hypothetical protein U5J83_03210 [Bryobacterales bacterium]|nr:hypothetical protein [Bryobacterales bacterium]
MVALALFTVLAAAQGNDPRWRQDDRWGDDGYRGRDRDDRWDRDDDWGRDRDDRWNRGRSSRSFGYPLDPRFRERSRDHDGRRGGRFEFRGRIDDEVLFFIRGGQVTVQNRAGRGMLVERWSMDDSLPVGRPVRIDLDRKDGRGRVQLVEAPSPRNNYTAVVRVFDPNGGSDRYHIRLDWRY